MLTNLPTVRLGLLAVSRDCFDIALSQSRRAAVAAACHARNIELYEVLTTVESETDAVAAVREATANGCNALMVFLGNFGPETPEPLIGGLFSGPVAYCAAAEDSKERLIDGRGDAYCGLLNCSYNLGLRGLRAYIPPYPVGDAEDIAGMIGQFLPVARTLIGLSRLKIITFGPRPQDFFACNAPIAGLYSLGVEVQENSELDLLAAFRAHRGDPRIKAVAEEMTNELGQQIAPGVLEKMARFELTLTDWAQQNRGARDYVAFANKCWPAFPTEFGFEPCYVNSRLTARGIPVACEVDIYGALSEYIGTCITAEPVTLLDINNTVPKDLFREAIEGRYPYRLTDTFMGFHCGNTPLCKLKDGRLRYHLIQNRLLEGGAEPVCTYGTLEGDIVPGDITLFRLHAGPDSALQAYVAQGEVLPVKTHSFGGIGVIAVPEMGRFYRHVLIRGRYPHHAATAFGHIAQPLYAVFNYLGIASLAYNQPSYLPYPGECPFPAPH